MPLTYEKLKGFSKKTDDVRLADKSDNGKSMRCLLYGKTTKIDKSKKSNRGRLKYFRCVHVCSARVGSEAVNTKTRRIDEFYQNRMVQW